MLLIFFGLFLSAGVWQNTAQASEYLQAPNSPTFELSNKQVAFMQCLNKERTTDSVLFYLDIAGDVTQISELDPYLTPEEQHLIGAPGRSFSKKSILLSQLSQRSDLRRTLWLLLADDQPINESGVSISCNWPQ